MTRVVQLSDTHISLDAPQRTRDLENCINAINELQAQPDLVIHTGDIANRGSSEEYQIARQALSKLDAPYCVIPGNRDRRVELASELASEHYELSEQGWIQYSIERYPVRLIMVDTLNEQSNKGQLCSERLGHLKTMLSADTSKPVAIFLHHAPFEAVGIPDPFQYDDWDDVEQLSSLLSQFTNIQGMYCGHVHRFMDGTVGGVKASAISCMASDLRRGKVTDEERKLPVFKTINLSH